MYGQIEWNCFLQMCSTAMQCSMLFKCASKRLSWKQQYWVSRRQGARQSNSSKQVSESFSCARCYPFPTNSVERSRYHPFASALFSFFFECSNLASLGLAWNAIRKEGAVALAEALRSTTTLKEFNVAWNQFGGAAVLQLGASLSENSSVEFIDLSHNTITSQECITLAVALRANQTVRRVILDGNAPGKHGAAALLRAVLYRQPRLLSSPLSQQDLGSIPAAVRADCPFHPSQHRPPLEISLQNCNCVTSHPSDFDAHAPSVDLQLSLSSLYDRCVGYTVFSYLQQLLMS